MTLVFAFAWTACLLAAGILTAITGLAVLIEIADRSGRRVLERARTDLNRDRLP